MPLNNQILHISAECYPAAKTGGLADVAGALPKYLNDLNHPSSVVIPKYALPWINNQEWREVFAGSVWMGYYDLPFRVHTLTEDLLGFPLFVVDIPGKFDRPGIYADQYGNFYGDEVERFISFQKAVLRWVQSMEQQPAILHCHDHHTGLIPFFLKHCPEYESLKGIPSIFTIHNGRYHGSFGWDRRYLLPHFENHYGGLIEWNGSINPLAAGIKNSWRLTTVSNAYLDELRSDSAGLEWLLHEEWRKSVGILNGIDTNVWDPKTDPSLSANLKKSVSYFKRENKRPLCDTFGLNKKWPLISFIGRFAIEKGADILPDVVYHTLSQGWNVNLFILGSGDPVLQDALNHLRHRFQGRYNTYIGYNEALAHQIYAGSDFLVMPSRVEPCGLNQMYAMRYGTVPIVRRTGGLKDSVTDIGEPEGTGIMFNHVWTGDIMHAYDRAITLYEDKKKFQEVVGKNMELDFSWERSATAYINIYEDVKNERG